MQTKLPIITLQECRERLHAHVPDDQICTFDISRRRSACRGDEGGPLVYEERLLGMLISAGWLDWTHPDIFFNFNNNEIHELVNFHINEVRGVH